MNKITKNFQRKIRNFSGIKKISNLELILQSNARIFFIDIEETILAPNIFYELIAYDSYRNLFFDICNENKHLKIFDIMYYGKNFQRKLMETNIPEVLEKLKSQGKIIFALTSGCPSMQKKDRIKEHGIQFNGYLFTRGSEKGPFLVNFLNKNKMYEKCTFVDNHMEKVFSVKNSYYKLFKKPLSKQNIQVQNIECLLYTRNYVSNISESEFVSYWKSVVQSIEEGALEILRKRIEKETMIKRKKRLESL